MKLVNLTHHAITLHGDYGIITLPPSGTVARLTVTRQALPHVVVDGVPLPVNRPTIGAVTGLPSPEPGVLFVVSALLAEAVKRPDVVSPGELIRDDAGVIVGARGLCAYTQAEEEDEIWFAPDQFRGVIRGPRSALRAITVE